jgi:hypothetical protein
VRRWLFIPAMTRITLRSALVLSCTPFLFQCSGKVVNALSSPDAGADTGRDTGGGPETGDGPESGGAPEKDGGIGPVSSCSTVTSLVGTWDLLGAAPGSPSESGLLVLQNDFFSIQIGGSALTYTGANQPIVWVDPNNGQVSIAATRTPGSFGLGVIPLALGGTWSFENQGSEASASLLPGSFTATCNGTSDLPSPLPNSIDGTASANKTTSLTSVFGDLSGQWNLTTASDTCIATITGNTMSVTCSGDDTLDGTVQATFCNGVVSGSTSSGVAFTGRLQ